MCILDGYQFPPKQLISEDITPVFVAALINFSKKYLSPSLAFPEIRPMFFLSPSLTFIEIGLIFS